jgi:hypothetical protein
MKNLSEKIKYFALGSVFASASFLGYNWMNRPDLTFIYKQFGFSPPFCLQEGYVQKGFKSERVVRGGGPVEDAKKALEFSLDHFEDYYFFDDWEVDFDAPIKEIRIEVRNASFKQKQ